MIKKEIIKYFKENEMDFQRATAILTACDMIYGAYSNSHKLHGIDFSPIFIGSELKNSHSVHRQMVAKKIILSITEKIYADYLKDQKSLGKLITEHTALEAEIDKVWDRYTEKRSSDSNKEIAQIYKDFLAVSERWWYYGSILEDHGEIIHNKIVPKFAEKHNLDLARADEVFNILSHPEEQTILSQERIRFLDICLEVAKGKNPNEKIESYVKDYFWFKSNFHKVTRVTKESLLDEAKREIENNKIAGLMKEVKDLRENFKKLHDEKAKILSTIKLTPEDKIDLEFAKKVIYWMDIRKIGMMKDFYYLMEIAEDTSKKTKIPYDDLAAYTTDELGRLLDFGERINIEEIKKRKDGILTVWQKGKNREIIYGKDFVELLEETATTSHGGDLKGQVASKGGVKSVRGKIKIVFHPESDDFNSGDILVTSMTRIEFVPLMRKAKAIITNEGGIACHAAIVSRELGIPAIIGTKVGTRILKNGDNVEIDLEEGIIKVIHE